MPKIPVLYSDTFLTDYRTVDCENPDRISQIHTFIKEIADFIGPQPCDEKDLLLCHSENLIHSVKRDREVYEVARLAAGGAIQTALISLKRPAFGLIRPPGHHAGYNFNGGFCFFNNMAIAIKHLFAEKLITNALIVDIDLHYGNGTYDIVKGDKSIVFKNIDAYSQKDFFQQLRDAIESANNFDIIGCSAGFDTYVRDWGGILSTDDFEEIGYLLARSNPHLFSLLEGGYYIPDLGKNVCAYLKGIQKACL